jgi:hypothetical protein
MYHHHEIDSTPVYDNKTGKWKATASVSWRQNGAGPGVRFLPSSLELFDRFEDAEHAGLEAGKNWVEHVTKEPSSEGSFRSLQKITT